MENDNGEQGGEEEEKKDSSLMQQKQSPLLSATNVSATTAAAAAAATTTTTTTTATTTADPAAAAASQSSSPPPPVSSLQVQTTLCDNDATLADDATATATTPATTPATTLPFNLETFLLETCGINIHDVILEESWQLRTTLFHVYRIPIIVGMLALVTTSPGRRLLQSALTLMILFALRLLAWALGIALGLGWAIHVYEQLDTWHAKQQLQLQLQLQQEGGEEEEWAAADGGGHMHHHPAAPNARTITRRGSNFSDTQSLGANRVRLNTGGSHSYRTVRTTSGALCGGGGSGMTTVAGGGTGLGGIMSQRTISISGHGALEDEQTYASLMLVAGYSVPTKILRGQVLRHEDDFWKLQYTFTNSKSTITDNNNNANNNNSDNNNNDTATTILQQSTISRALNIMQDFWPTLPTVINEQLALWMEYILRDYVAAWYSRADLSICYQDAAKKKNKQKATSASSPQSKQDAQEQEEEFHRHRRVLYSTARHRNVPFVDSLYESMAIIFGNLATRVEHVNVLQVVLLKWTRILAHTFKVYRHLRRQVRIKQLTHNNNNNSNNNQHHASQSPPSAPPRRRRSGPQQQQPSSLSLSSPTSQQHAAESSSSSPHAAVVTPRTNGCSAASTATSSSKSPVVAHYSAATAAASFASSAFDTATASLSAAAASTSASATASLSAAALAASTVASSLSGVRGGGGEVRAETTTTSTRDSREQQQQQQQRPPVMVESAYKVSEISMTKEFLFCGKLHRAITFGLDVPALLFADATGRECGIPKSSSDYKNNEDDDDPLNAAQRVPNNDDNNTNNNNNNVMIEDAVLEARLFGNSKSAPSNILQECELDYNRVLAHRMVRALLRRGDFGCNIVSSFVTEIMAGCILSPIMSCFGPDYINGWIIKGLSSSSATTTPTTPSGNDDEEEVKKQQEQDAKTAHAGASGNATNGNSSNDVLRGWNKTTAIKKDDVDDDVLEKQSIERRLTVKITSPESSRDGKQQNDAGNTSNNISNSSKQQQLSVEPPPSPLAETLDYVIGQASTASLPADDDERGPTMSTQEQQQQDKESSSLYIPPPLPETPSEEGDSLLTQLAMALIDLQRFLDFEEFRDAREANREFLVDWDDAGCRGAVLQLVLVIEASLTHGRKNYKQRNNKDNDQDDDDDDASPRDSGEHNTEDHDDVDGLLEPEAILDDVEVTLPEYESATFSQILMELTSDIEAFEERVAMENTLAAERGKEQRDKDGDDQKLAEPYKPTATEQSTLRTLIAAWFHTGQIYRTVTVLVQAHATVLAPYYNRNAFLRSHVNAAGFVRQLKALNGVDVLVDTMAVLASPRLDEIHNNEQISILLQRSSHRPSVNTGRRQPANSDALSPMNNQLATQQYMPNTATPRHSDFHRNEAFAASLRSERERRSMSWYAQFDEDFDDGSGGGVPIVCHVKGGSEEDTIWHRELHHLARIFYSGTNLIAIRDAARRKNSREADATTGVVTQTVESSELSLLTVETACPRRRIEVPDDDSSFLLRAQPRPLNAMGVHRDQRNHDHSFKCFAATYEEPALPRGSDHFLAGGRYVRRCLVRYYPIDRTASVLLQNNDVRKLDQRKGKTSSNSHVPETITVGQHQARPTPFLTSEFLRERHLCQRWVPKGTMRTQSILASSVMEPTDFTSQPRAGKAIDFVYRLTFFEKPMILLGDKHFTVHDSSSLGSHHADASSMEISDAALSASLCIIGETEASSIRHPDTEIRQVEMGEDGYPIIWMKFSRKQDNAHVEVKPYRISFVRAALLVTAARQEAQLQSLVRCVRAGSAKSATKALTDARLKPTLRLLEYAGHRSREKQSLLLRDLKLGVNHIDREQLRRNGLWRPRYPTTIKELFVSVEDALQAEEVRDADLYGATGTVYKIHCAVMVELIADDEEMEYDTCYRTERGELAAIYKEEWVVYRSFKEFQAIHKHLKNQVSTSESSGTAVSRLSASLNASGTTQGRRQRRSSLIPSLSQASKIGSLGITKKSQEKRKEHLDEYLGYLLAPGHLLNRSPELLLFVGAFYPLPSVVRVGRGTVSGVPDPLGRTQMSRTAIQRTIREIALSSDGDNVNAASGTPHSRGAILPSQGSTGDGLEEEDVDEETENSRKAKRKLDMLPSIRNKIDKVPLSQVRNRVFELLRYQFGFENASFVRNRMLATLKTASFAVTSASEFRRTLYNLHLEHLSADSLAGWIHFGLDILWPDGVFYQSSPPLTASELVAEAEKAKSVLHESFPDSLRTILGQDLTKDGLDIFHEMLQNRVVVKSMAYMLFDVLWLEVFPEIGDLLQGGAALDMDNNN